MYLGMTGFLAGTQRDLQMCVTKYLVEGVFDPYEYHGATANTSATKISLRTKAEGFFIKSISAS